MLHFDIIDVYEGIDVNAFFATIIIFQIMGFKFKPDICNGCRDVLLMSMKLNYIAILNIHSVDYGCNINGISKSEALNLPQC